MMTQHHNSLNSMGSGEIEKLNNSAVISCIQQISSDPGDWSLNIRCQVTEIISTDQRSGSSRIIGVEILSARATLATILSKLQTLPCHSQIQLFISYCFSIVKINVAVTVMFRTRPQVAWRLIKCVQNLINILYLYCISN